MNNTVLVTYASQGGATAGVAEAIGRALTETGACVDVLPVDSVGDLNGYNAVVIGSAVHSGKWMPEMVAFVERNQNHLRRVPTAAFQVCMMLATGSETYRRMVQDWFAPLHAYIRPAGEASFAGALWPDTYPRLSEKLGLRIFLAAIKLKAGDCRDWEAIHAWARQMSLVLCR